MVDLRMTEFFYSQRPKELAEYYRLKSKAEAETEVKKDNASVEQLAEEIARKSIYPMKGTPRKKKKRKKRVGVSFLWGKK